MSCERRKVYVIGLHVRLTGASDKVVSSISNVPQASLRGRVSITLSCRHAAEMVGLGCLSPSHEIVVEEKKPEVPVCRMQSVSERAEFHGAGKGFAGCMHSRHHTHWICKRKKLRSEGRRIGHRSTANMCLMLCASP